MTRAPFALAFVAALALAPSTAVSQGAQAVRDVLTYQTAATDAFLRNDADAIDSLLADDFTLTDSRGRISSRADAAAEARAGAVRYSEFRNVDQQVRLYLGGRVAVVTGRTLVAGTTADGASFRQDLPFTDTLVLLAGRWRMVSSHVSAPPPA